MKHQQHNLEYETPSDFDILETYINKNLNFKRKDTRQIKRALRKLRAC